jgi:hypothetical protein
MQKGLKLHNAFVHWRNAGDELWSGVLYFVIALVDKWVALLSGGSILGLSDASSMEFRLAVGFGLAYFLIGAVFLDGVGQPLWQLAKETIPQPIVSLQFLRQAAINDAQARRQLYLKYFIKFFFIHIWGLGITSALMWSFDNSRNGTVMYMAYVGAYFGLLLYLYNRIFTGARAFREPFIASVIGLLVGLILNHFQFEFPFNNVIALAVATWTAALLSLRRAHLGAPRAKYDTVIKTTPVVHSSTALGPRAQLSQKALSDIVDTIYTLPAEFRHTLDPFTHPGVEVMTILMSRSKSPNPKLVQAAFPSAEQLIYRTAELWKNGDTVVELVPRRHILQQEQNMRSITRTISDRVHIFVFLGLDLVGGEWIMDIRRNCKV